MLIALALIAQTVPLNPEADQAIGCAVALRARIRVTPGMSRLTAGAQIFYFVMSAAKADPGTATQSGRTTELRLLAMDEPLPTLAEADRTLALCDRLYPLARRAAPARLPADTDQRNLICSLNLSFMRGVARALNENGEPESLARLQPAHTYYLRVTPEQFERRALSGTQVEDELDRAGFAGLAIGNAETIMTSCIAQMPAN